MFAVCNSRCTTRVIDCFDPRRGRNPSAHPMESAPRAGHNPQMHSIRDDEADFERAVAPYRTELLAHCYRMLGSRADAEDALQETMLRAWRGLSGFEGRSSLRSWLYTIATNASLKLIEKRPKRIVPVDFGRRLQRPSASAPGRRRTAARTHAAGDPARPWGRPHPRDRRGLHARMAERRHRGAPRTAGRGRAAHDAAAPDVVPRARRDRYVPLAAAACAR